VILAWYNLTGCENGGGLGASCPPLLTEVKMGDFLNGEFLGNAALFGYVVAFFVILFVDLLGNGWGNRK